MYEEIVAAVLSFPLADSNSNSTDVLKVALVGGVATVAAALGPALIGRKEREPKIVRELRATEQRLRNQLAAERDEWRSRALTSEAVATLLDDEVDRLREMMLQAHPPLDPGPRKVRNDSTST